MSRRGDSRSPVREVPIRHTMVELFKMHSRAVKKVGHLVIYSRIKSKEDYAYHLEHFEESLHHLIEALEQSLLAYSEKDRRGEILVLLSETKILLNYAQNPNW